jgi:hypothetical protein
MNPENKVDWSVLQSAIIVFFISLIVSASLVAGTWYYEDNMKMKYNFDKKRFQTISNQYLAVKQEEKLVKQYYPEFISLYNKGIIGQERRLNWIETLRNSSENSKLISLRYEIDPQVQYTPDYTLNYGIYKLFNSAMKLNMDLLHTGDLKKLINDLNRNTQGTFNISSCKLKRTGGSRFAMEIKPNIAAECKLHWFNIKRSDGSDITMSQS